MSERVLGWIAVDRVAGGAWGADAFWPDAAAVQQEIARFGVEYPEREWAVARVVLEAT